MAKKTKQEILESLAQFTGSESFHYNRMFGKNFVYTDGVAYLIDACESYWLLDAVLSYRKVEDFQLWKLTVNADKTAVLTMKEDTGCPNLVKQEFDYTTFPLEEIEFYAINDHCREDGIYGDRVVLLLKSEY